MGKKIPFLFHNKKIHLFFLIVSVFFLVGCKDRSVPGGTSSTGVKWTPYNVLLITLDTLRFDRLSVYSNLYVTTPNIDKLAKKSAVFTRAFSHNPVTLPAHTNILTGTTPLYHGISDNSGYRLEEKFLTLAEYLKSKGYRTGAFLGAFPLDSRFGLDQGFDVYDDNYGTHSSLEMFFVERPAEKVIAPAVQWISQQDRLWFAWIHLFDPHQPYAPPPPYDVEFADDLYSGEVAYMDASLGVLFDFMAEKKLWANTAVVLTADHGEALGEKGELTHSYFAYNNTIHVPLVLYIPGLNKKIVEDNVSHVDLFPTVCDLLGMDIPSQIQGESLLPILEGQKRRNPEIYFESLTPYLNRGWAPLRGFIKENVKYIDLPIQEVYDLSEDMEENRNLALKWDAGRLNSDLNVLIQRLQGPDRMMRSENVETDVQKKLKSLGYVSGMSSPERKLFTEKFDLKTLLPLQNRMLDALGKYQKGRARESIEELRGIITENSGFILVYNHLAAVYKEIGQIGNAVDVLREGLKENPGNLSLMSNLGIILAEANMPDEAIGLLEICTVKQSFNPENFNYLGVAFYKKGDYDSALKSYQEALKLDKNYASVYNNIGSLNLSRYLKTKEKTSFDLAILNFNKALEIDPRLFAAYNGRGAAFRFSDDVKKAISDWEKAIEIKPDFIDPYFNIGVLYLETGDKTSALDYFLLCKKKFYMRLPENEKQRLDRLISEAQR